MKVKIESDKHGCGNVYLDGVPANLIRSLTLQVSAGEVNTLMLEYSPREVQFEGEAKVIAVIDGRRYQLIEETQEAEETER